MDMGGSANPDRKPPVVGLSKDSIEGMRAFADRRETDFKGY